MYVLVVLLLIASLIIVLLATNPIKVAFSYDSEQMNEYRMIFSWLKPAVSGSVTKVNNKTILNAYFFNKKIIEKELKGKALSQRDKINMIREIHPHLIKLQTSYGFMDPSVTGMVCGSINMISEYIGVDDLYNHPDFSVDHDYFNAHATAEVDALNSLRIMLKNRNKVSKMQPQY
jgi:hypothetical protein